MRSTSTGRARQRGHGEARAGRFARMVVLALVVTWPGIACAAPPAPPVAVFVNGTTSNGTIQVTQGVPITLSAAVTGCPAASSYQEVWDFGNGVTRTSTVTVSPCSATPPSSTYTYLATGSFTVTFSYSPCQSGVCSPTISGSASVHVQRGSVGAALASFSIQPASYDAINCQPEPVTITALNGGGVVLTSFTGTATLSTSTGHGDWSLLSGSGTLTPGPVDSGQAVYQFASADNGQVVVGLRDTHAETLTITSTWPGVSSTSGAVTYRPYGFSVTPNPIGTQVAAKPFNMVLTAVGNPPTGTGCTVITEYTGIQNISFWSTYMDPSTNPFGSTVSVNGTSVGTTESAATSVQVNFTNGVSAPISVIYPDAGSIQLQAKDNINVGAPPAGSGSEIVVGGAAFVVRPFGFDVTVAGNPGTAYNPATGLPALPSLPAFIRAGQATGDTFAATVRAVQWQAADDTNNDGIPDGFGDTDPSNNANLADNPTTPNFGNESTPAGITLSAVDLSPLVADGGTAGILSGAATLTASNGSATTGSVLRYSEAGVIELDADTNNYLGANSVSGGSAPVGRFYPDHFAVVGTPTLVNRSDVAGCTDPFTYMDEDFHTQFTLEAQDADGNVTRNYETVPGKFSYAFLNIAPDAPAGAGQIGFGAVNDPAGTPTALTPRLAEDSVSGTFSNGIAQINAALRITRTSTVSGPFSNLRIGIKPVDSDGVALAAGALNLDPTLSGTNTHEQIASTDVRQGRVVLENAFGSQYLDLRVPLYAQYYSGPANGFVTNSADSCTAIGTSLLDLSNNLQNPAAGVPTIKVGTGSTTAMIANDPMVGGDAALNLSEPGDSGYVDINLNLATLPWLQYDWNGNGVNDNNPPQARATFGSYRGDDRIIFWREKNQ